MNAQTHRHTDTQTEVLIPEYPIKASAFQASACDMSGPIIDKNTLEKNRIAHVLSKFHGF